MRNRFLVLMLALLCLLTAQCLLACSTAQQAAHACCPHKDTPDQTVVASIPIDPISIQLDSDTALLIQLATLPAPEFHARVTPQITGPPEPPLNQIQVLRV